MAQRKEQPDRAAPAGVHALLPQEKDNGKAGPILLRDAPLAPAPIPPAGLPPRRPARVTRQHAERPRSLALHPGRPKRGNSQVRPRSHTTLRRKVGRLTSHSSEIWVLKLFSVLKLPRIISSDGMKMQAEKQISVMYGFMSK